ncbi:MAG: ABC transporter permease [Clostridia bacterium]
MNKSNKNNILDDGAKVAVKSNFWLTIGKFIDKYKYFFAKIGVSLLTLALSTILLFFLLRQIPGDIIELYALKLQGSQGISYDRAYELAKQLLNFDPNEDVFSAFFRYVGGLFRGELGASYLETGVSANSLIKTRLPWTLFISTCALAISFVLGTLLGGVVAQKRNSVTDKIVSSYVAVSGSIPDYLMGLLLVIIFSYTLGIFPSQNNYDAFSVTPGFNLPFIGSCLYYAFLPIMSFVLVQTGNWILQMRGSCIGVLGEDYILAARARGISEKTIRRKYMKKNALLPLITSLGVSFGALFGGSTLMETIFNYPGLGLEISGRIISKDYMVVQGLIFFSAAMVIAVNLITDLIYPLIDPRVRKD